MFAHFFLYEKCSGYSTASLSTFHTPALAVKDSNVDSKALQCPQKTHTTSTLTHETLRFKLIGRYIR